MRAVSYLSPGLPSGLFETFADAVGADLWFETATSGPVSGDDPFADGRADIGWICSTSFVDTTWVAGAGVVLVGVGWVPDDPAAEGRPVYFGDLVTRSDAGIDGLDDLPGRAVGGNDPISLSGHHALRIAAAERDVDLEGVDLRFTGGHQASMDAVVDGELDGAVVDSVARTARARRDPRVGKLRVVERLGPWPVQPLVARADLDPVAVRSVRDALLAARADRSVQAALREAALVDLAPTDAADYRPVAAALARTGTTVP